jgi:hypothetical protein
VSGQGEGGNEDHINLDRVVCARILIGQSDGGRAHPPETLGIYGQVQIVSAAAGFHFDKGNFFAAPGDDIYFTGPNPYAPPQNAPAMQDQP